MAQIALGAREEKRRFWEEPLSRGEASGLSQKEYCRQSDPKIHCISMLEEEPTIPAGVLPGGMTGAETGASPVLFRADPQGSD